MALPNTALPARSSRRPSPLLRLALGAAVAGGVLLPAAAGPALAAVPGAGAAPAGSTAGSSSGSSSGPSSDPSSASSSVHALPDRCGVRVTLRDGSGPHDVAVRVRTAAPTTPAGQAVVLEQDGRYRAEAGSSRDLAFRLDGAHPGDPQGHRVEVTVTVDGGAAEQTLLWLPRCVQDASPTPTSSASPTAPPSASPSPSPSATSPTASPTGTPSPAAEPTATPPATPTPTAGAPGTPSGTPTPSATATATTSPAPGAPGPSGSSPGPSSPAPDRPSSPPAAPASSTGGGTGSSGTVVLAAPVPPAPAAVSAAPPLVAAAGGIAALPSLGAPAGAAAGAAPLPQVAASDAQLFPAPPPQAEPDVLTTSRVAAPLTEEPGALADVLPAGTALALTVLALRGLVRRRPA